MLRPAGYATITDPDARLVERDTASCCHCSAVIFVKPRTASTVFLVYSRSHARWVEVPGASCWHCMKPVCLACHALGVCTPLERQLESWEHRAHAI